MIDNIKSLNEKFYEKLAFVEKFWNFKFQLIGLPIFFAFYNYFVIKSVNWVFFYSLFAGAFIFLFFVAGIKQAIENKGKFPRLTYAIFLPIVFMTAHSYIGFLAMGLAGSKNNAFDFVLAFFLISFLFTVIGLFITFIMYKIFLKLEKGFVQNFNLSIVSSYLNPLKILRGFKWADFKELQTTLNGEVYVDNFQIIDKRENHNAKTLENIENTDLKFKRKDFTKTTLAIGKAGSGKTEFFLNLSFQNKKFENFKRELYHDVKGDFTSKLFNPKTDFILNLYDERGLNWDIWTDLKHNESMILSFSQNLLTSQVDKPDFWTSSAGKLLGDKFLEVHFTCSDLTSAEKWKKLLDLLEEYKSSIDDDKTKQSIWQTLELGLTHINLMAYDGIKSNKRAFSLYDWCYSNGSRLFLLNNASYSKSLNPYFTGFLACLIEILLSKPDIKDDNLDLTLMILDEYLSLKLDEDVRLKMLTQIRSKGGCLALGVQYLDASDKKQKQLIGSSTYAKFLFNVSDDETVDTFVKAYGNVEWEKTKLSTSTSSSKITGSANNGGSGLNSTSTLSSTEDKSLPFLTPEIIKGLTNFRHLTLIDEKQLYYCGYTKKVELPEKNEYFIKADMNKFYKWTFDRQKVEKE